MTPRYSRRVALQRGLLAAGSLGVGMDLLARAPSALARANESQGGEAALAAANLAFAFRLFGQLAMPKQNTFISPLSVSLALAMTANGALGATRQAILDTLALGHMNLAALNQASAALIGGLDARDPQVQLAIADSLWTRQGLAVQQSFARTLQRSYGAEVTALDFGAPSAPRAINSWVSHKTHGLIAQIVSSIPPNALLYLINALYFKARWSLPFPSPNTRQQPFTLLGGRQTPVPLMSVHGMFSYYEDASLQAIALPYAAGKFSMVVLLPAAGTDFTAFQRGLNPDSWAAVLGKLSGNQGTIGLPRFTVNYGVALNRALSALGMGVAFGPRANLGGIFTDAQAGISAVMHKAVMKVYEAGTTAAAVTAVVGAALATREQFSMTVDRPFFCAIRDNTSGTLLFMGAIVDPR